MSFFDINFIIYQKKQKKKQIETISVLKFPQVQGSLKLARKVAVDQIAYENEARGLKSLKILGFSRYNEGAIGDEAVNNPKPL